MGNRSGDPYLSEGIIAYIGNKRRLLPLIGDALNKAAGGPLDGLRFADPFCGSGIVSRFARRLGMKVTANDWEPYARVLAKAWLEPVPADIVRIFGGSGGLEEAVDKLNHLPPPAEEEEYLARYYAPSSPDPSKADYRTERLFYTRWNALKLDAARNWIDIALAKSLPDSDDDLRRCLLLAPIIYAAATYVNTSGVFKAFHKGFGGHGKDALSRIMRPIDFIAPTVIDAPPGKVYSRDTAELVSEGLLSDADIVYLDPPYNQHQYGSNYHLLNTLVKWDRVPEPLDLGPDGRLVRKAGIRRDWAKTRSEYCSRRTACNAFSELLDGLKAPLLLVSYSTDGIIPFDKLRSLCEDYGRLRLEANPYPTYRGGRQSVRRKDRNLEFVLIVEKGRSTGSRNRRDVDRILLERRIQLKASGVFRPESLASTGRFKGNSWYPDLPEGSFAVEMRHSVQIVSFPKLGELTDADLHVLSGYLDEAICRTRSEELEVLEETWIRNPEDCREVIKEIPRILRKMAHRKYQEEFERHLTSLRGSGQRYPECYSLISGEIDKIEELAARRFAG